MKKPYLPIQNTFVIANGVNFIKFGRQPAGRNQTYVLSKDFKLSTTFNTLSEAENVKKAFSERLDLEVEAHTKSIRTYQKRVAKYPVASNGEIPLQSFMAMYNTKILEKEIQSKLALTNELRVMKISLIECCSVADCT